ncbi:M35 family metallo-endopeptidase [Parachitinimonas caeni]|uniref:M35 family metallo-endopeptidase n=1 Tax=Parachitinimonas caeni TaxID=3031301 RepID=A0ABT7DWU7_9NEIS|nr:M35 family metallo-endopeptidase [Parachitinimonas caeni]MDK2124537.1 M35 family metallo-endopeptidase [Parachitinimonas caeni]
MQTRWIIAAALSVAAVPAFAQDIQVSIATAKTTASAGQGVDVHVKFTNTGKQAVYLPHWVAPSGSLQDRLFEVSVDGNAVAYVGPQVKRAAPSLNTMLKIQPGQSVTRTINVSSMYDMSKSGKYSIRYNLGALNYKTETPNLRGASAASQRDRVQDLFDAVESNAVTMDVEGRLNPLSVKADALEIMAQNAFAASITYAANCSSSRRTSIATAVNSATTYASNAASYLAPAGSNTQRYKTWFGNYTSTRWGTARTHFNNIKTALTSKPLSFDCGCTESGTYAYVYPNSPYKIYLCGAFWSAPNTGTDSRAGTIVHELSHFTVVAGTDDHAYGQSAAKSLASSNPDKALDNADNHEYFAENTPALP